MRSSPACFALLALLLLITGTTLIDHSDAMSSDSALVAPGQLALARKREAAYRANNLGAAMLEQYRAKEAAESFTRALQLQPDLLMARINLSIALFYLPDADGARREAEKALARNPSEPRPHYILGLIARSRGINDKAIAELQQVLKFDPDDVATNITLGQLYTQQKNYAEARAAFTRALAQEPYNETALYNLGLLLTRTGAREEGQRLMQKFQQLRESGAGTSIGANYLEQGKYAEAVVSTGAESELVDRNTPDVFFTEASDALLPPDTRKAEAPTEGTDRFQSAMLETNARAQAIVLFDYDGDGDLDIFDGSSSQRLLRNDGGAFTDMTAGSGLAISGSRYCFAAIAGDFDNDGKPDLFVVRSNETQFLLYHNNGQGGFSDRTSQSGIKVPSAAGPPYLSAAFVDIDHDGDLDIFITGPTNILWRNNGNGTFADITDSAKVGASNSSAMAAAIIPTDYDNRRDIDLLLLPHNDPPMLFRNLRDGTFRNVANEVGLDGQGFFLCAAAGDVNKDGFTDFFLGTIKAGVFAISDGRGHFKLSPAPAATKEALAAQFLDYDNDGLLDLIVVTTAGLRIWRNVGNDFVDAGERALKVGFQSLDSGFRGIFSGRTALMSGDLDGDGDVDLVLRGPGGGLRVLRNDGGNRNHSVAVKLSGLVSNKSAVEAKIEMRAGSLWQRTETYSASPAPAPADVIFGLGKREAPDALRVLWPAGIVQAETKFPARKESGSFISLNITELDRKPSSCPYLYTWNGERFEFVTDFMGGGEMGYLEEPGRYNQPDPDEYVRIRGDQLKEKDGRYELRVTNELEESMFVDRLQLIAVAHPPGTEVYPNEGMSDPPKPFKLFITHNARPPLSATDDHGHDTLDRIARMDRRWPDDFKLDQIRGYAAEHSLTMKLAEPAVSRRTGGRMVLLLTGWTDYAWSSDNVAASQAGKTMTLPALQVRDQSGQWRTVIADIGIPVGRPQTVTVDLTGKFLSANREVRIVTNMRIYWDQVLFDSSNGDAPATVTRLDPLNAELRWRGFSAEVTSDGREPFGYDYQQVAFASPWKVMTGHYTRTGDVRELLLQSDDMFVISRPGDEINLSFDARGLPHLPAGWTRTFLLYADGFSKEMDINSASPAQLAPLPFHGMSRYPYQWPEHYPLTDERRTYIEKYNTRVVAQPVSLIDAAILGR